MFKITAKKYAFFFMLVGITAGICFFGWRRPTSRIVQVSSIAQVDQFLDLEVLNSPKSLKNILVLFDLDNTLIEPTTGFASDQWFDACLKFYQTKGFTVQQAIKIVFPLWANIFHTVNMRAVELDTVQILEKLLSKLAVIAVTTRSLPLFDLTFRQLNSVGINFKKSVLARYSFVLKDYPIRFENGVLFCNGTDKGLAVTKLLKELKINPELIIFVDDKEKHLQAVARAAQQQNIAFIGLRYGFLDEKVKNFKLDNGSIALLGQYNKKLVISTGAMQPVI